MWSPGYTGDREETRWTGQPVLGPCRRRSRSCYRTTENRKVAFGTEPVDQILSVDFNDSGPLQALFYGLQELQESAPALC